MNHRKDPAFPLLGTASAREIPGRGRAPKQQITIFEYVCLPQNTLNRHRFSGISRAPFAAPPALSAEHFVDEIVVPTLGCCGGVGAGGFALAGSAGIALNAIDPAVLDSVAAADYQAAAFPE